MDKTEMGRHLHQSLRATIELNCSNDSLNRICHGFVRHLTGSAVE